MCNVVETCNSCVVYKGRVPCLCVAKQTAIQDTCTCSLDWVFSAAYHKTGNPMTYTDAKKRALKKLTLFKGH